VIMLCTFARRNRATVECVVLSALKTYAVSQSHAYQSTDDQGKQLGRVMARAVSRWPLTAKAQVRARVSSCGICGG
jgi:predicted secreted Zn-dependent protease